MSIETIIRNIVKDELQKIAISKSENYEKLIDSHSIDGYAKTINWMRMRKQKTGNDIFNVNDINKGCKAAGSASNVRSIMAKAENDGLVRSNSNEEFKII